MVKFMKITKINSIGKETTIYININQITEINIKESKILMAAMKKNHADDTDYSDELYPVEYYLSENEMSKLLDVIDTI